MKISKPALIVLFMLLIKSALSQTREAEKQIDSLFAVYHDGTPGVAVAMVTA